MWLRRQLRRPLTWWALSIVTLGFAFALFWFQPWRLFTSVTVNDVLPSVAPAPTCPSSLPCTPSGPSGTADGGSTATPARLLASGTFVSHEHHTSGTVQLIQLADGKLQLVLRDLDTSDGPDLRVWLTDQPVTADAWHTFDDGRYIEVGKLKGNKGNQVYDLPGDIDLAGLRSVTVWCKRFSVSFGAADLTFGS